MWSTPSSTARRSTATAASRSSGAPITCGPASCMAPYPIRFTVRSPSWYWPDRSAVVVVMVPSYPLRATQPSGGPGQQLRDRGVPGPDVVARGTLAGGPPPRARAGAQREARPRQGQDRADPHRCGEPEARRQGARAECRAQRVRDVEGSLVGRGHQAATWHPGGFDDAVLHHRAQGEGQRAEQDEQEDGGDRHPGQEGEGDEDDAHPGEPRRDEAEAPPVAEPPAQHGADGGADAEQAEHRRDPPLRDSREVGEDRADVAVDREG